VVKLQGATASSKAIAPETAANPLATEKCSGFFVFRFNAPI
jgi:hypothetical protein